jgi:hypothetical protein
VPGWINAVSGGVKYNTTMPIAVPYVACKNSKRIAVSGWHTMSPTNVEIVPPFDVKKGSASNLKYFLGGAAVVLIVVAISIPVLGLIIAAAAALIGFIISLFSKCKKEPFSFSSQVTGIGCI